ncbi:MAG: hypothetical protein AVDCRST_MAG54-4644, partial [uncultured Actinomycetospora sp.]
GERTDTVSRCPGGGLAPGRGPRAAGDQVAGDHRADPRRALRRLVAGRPLAADRCAGPRRRGCPRARSARPAARHLVHPARRPARARRRRAGDGDARGGPPGRPRPPPPRRLPTDHGGRGAVVVTSDGGTPPRWLRRRGPGRQAAGRRADRGDERPIPPPRRPRGARPLPRRHHVRRPRLPDRPAAARRM